MSNLMLICHFADMIDVETTTCIYFIGTVDMLLKIAEVYPRSVLVILSVSIQW